MSDGATAIVRPSPRIWPKSALAGLVVYLIYFGILTAIVLPRGLATGLAVPGTPVVVSPMDDADALSKSLGTGDGGIYVRCAREIVETGWIHSFGCDTLWPPGIFVFDALAQRLVGPHGPVALALILMTIAIWAGALTLLFLCAQEAFKLSIALLIPLVPLLFPFMRGYLLAGGLFYSESPSAGLWAVGVLLLFFAAVRRPILFGLLAGLTLAAAAYLRSQVEIVVTVTTILVAAMFIAWRILLKMADGGILRLRRLSGYLVPKGVARQFFALCIALAAFHAVTLPWRTYNAFAHGRFAWVAGYDYYFRYVWTLPEDYQPVAEFIRVGGGPIGCAVDPGTCDQLRDQRRLNGEQSIPLERYWQLTVKTMLRHPISWTAYRLAYLPRYWFSQPAIARPIGYDLLSGTVLLLLAVAVFVFIASVPWGQGGLLLAATWLGLNAGTAITFMFTHYEVRYLYQYQSAAIIFFLVGFVRAGGTARRVPEKMKRLLSSNGAARLEASARHD
jgi:hypothetical protein